MTVLIDCLGKPVIPLEETHPDLAAGIKMIADGTLNAKIDFPIVYEKTEVNYLGVKIPMLKAVKL